MSVPLSVTWIGNANTGCVRLIDQTKLPHETTFRDCRTAEAVWDAICSMQVRGAPAIGITAAYGMVVGMQLPAACDRTMFAAELTRVADYLRGSRPTAINLSWAIDRMTARGTALLRDHEPPAVLAGLLAEANTIRTEDAAMCHAIGRHGAALIPDGGGVLTHCNTGGLATAEYGTAMATILTAHDSGKRFTVYADETRPLLQGARLTAWECQQHGVDVVLICDSMAAQVLREGRIGLVIVGADRIAANGDAANKIGTYSLAVLAKYHGVPFYIAAPSSTFDLTLPSGAGIPIEQRNPREVTHGFGRQTAPDNVRVYNPAFDMTPAELIRGLVTEKGIIEPVTTERIAAVLGGTG